MKTIIKILNSPDPKLSEIDLYGNSDIANLTFNNGDILWYVSPMKVLGIFYNIGTKERYVYVELVIGLDIDNYFKERMLSKV